MKFSRSMHHISHKPRSRPQCKLISTTISSSKRPNNSHNWCPHWQLELMNSSSAGSVEVRTLLQRWPRSSTCFHNYSRRSSTNKSPLRSKECSIRRLSIKVIYKRQSRRRNKLRTHGGKLSKRRSASNWLSSRTKRNRSSRGPKSSNLSSRSTSLSCMSAYRRSSKPTAAKRKKSINKQMPTKF